MSANGREDRGTGRTIAVPGARAACVLVAAGLLAALALPGARLGAGLTLAVLGVALAAAAMVGRRPRGVGLAWAATGLALAAQAALRDDPVLVVVDAIAAGWAATLALGPAARWVPVLGAAAGPWRFWLRGFGLVQVTLGQLLLRPRQGTVGPLARGAALSAALVAVFGALFASADGAFADAAGAAFDTDLAASDVIGRTLLGLAAAVVAGSVVVAVAPARLGPAAPGPFTRRGLERAEWAMPLAALVLLFAAFVAVQLRVLFGGQGYVLETTGLGYGEYARRGFVQLLLTAALTLSIVAAAVRLARRHGARDERVLRVLLGALCLLTGVVLASALHRLALVEDAYGFTRVRLAGQAVVFVLAGEVGLVVLAGVWRPVARHLPRLAAALALAGVLAYSASAPDARVARENVARFAATGHLDHQYVEHLGADAVPALLRLPARERRCVLAEQRRRLAGDDGGWSGANRARARARTLLARARDAGTERVCLHGYVGP